MDKYKNKLPNIVETKELIKSNCVITDEEIK